MLFFIAQLFIVNSKNFWDAIYYEKITVIYNAQFIFSSGDKVGLKKLYEESGKQLKYNRVTKIIVILGIVYAILFYIYEFLGIKVKLWVSKSVFNFSGLFNFSISIFILYLLKRSTERF